MEPAGLSRPPTTDALTRRDVGVLGFVVCATITADIAARRWVVAIFENHPIALGPIVFQVHRHVGSAFGFTRIAPSALLVIGAVLIAAAVITARHRSVIGATTSTGLVAGGAIAYATDKIADGAITEFVRFGPLPAAGVSGIAVVAGLVGMILDTWARNDPTTSNATED